MDGTPRINPSETADLVLELRPDGRLLARHGERTAIVEPVRCFPWSAPRRHISLRDDERREFALVSDPELLDERSRDALDRCLGAIGFVLEVTAILDVDEEVEIRTWTVDTKQGRRSFQTAKDAWPRELPDESFLVRDVAGDLYRVPPGDELDRRSQRLIWAFVDD